MSAMEELLAIMRRLRDPQTGCPWDLQQDFRSLVPHTLEEAYEVADAIEQGEYGELPGELGDLLFQVVFYAQLAQERDWFDFEDVAQGISRKLIRRHPHVFGADEISTSNDDEAEINDAASQTIAWEQRKARERAAKARVDNRTAGALDGVSRALPALSRAQKLQRRAARVGFDWPDVGGVLDKLREELAEVCAELPPAGDVDALREEVGDLIFTCVNLARHLELDAEAALRAANEKFERRFRRLEDCLRARGRVVDEASSEELEQIWSQIKDANP